jgi:hypothetical protein
VLRCRINVFGDVRRKNSDDGRSLGFDLCGRSISPYYCQLAALCCAAALSFHQQRESS